MDKNTRALKLENVTMKGGIITATSKTSKLRKGGKIVLTVNKYTRAEGVIISKLGTQIKARVTQVFTNKE